MSKLGLPHHGWSGETMPLASPIMPPRKAFSLLRLMHRLAAWRTRLSSHGEPLGKGQLPRPDVRLRVE